MKSYKIKDDSGKIQYHILEGEDFEYVNPILQISSEYINISILFDKKILDANEFNAPKKIVTSCLLKKAIEKWESHYKDLLLIVLPNNLNLLLEAETKKEQIKLLKGISLTSDEFVTFIFMAYSKYGYLYSQYKAEYFHRGLDVTQLPKVVHLENNGSITSIGKTNLTIGQQKQMIEHRKVIVSKFLDYEDNWHCFFLTFRSLGGKENYQNGTPHLHYISNKWGINRNEVLKQLTSKDYNLPSLPHIEFKRQNSID